MQGNLQVAAGALPRKKFKPPSTNRNSEGRFEMKTHSPYPPPENETRSAVPTEQAAFYLLRQKQTLRMWACHESGPIRPRRVNKRLAWPMADIRRVLGIKKS
jgi:hypothetical protein